MRKRDGLLVAFIAAVVGVLLSLAYKDYKKKMKIRKRYDECPSI
jgi:hypothetical protein